MKLDTDVQDEMKKNGGSKSNETGGVVESKMGGGFAQKMNDGLMGGIQEGDEEDEGLVEKKDLLVFVNFFTKYTSNCGFYKI